MARARRVLALGVTLTLVFAAAHSAETVPEAKTTVGSAFDNALARAFDRAQAATAAELLKDGQQIFRYDTFGSEEFWGGKLRLHETIEEISPRFALELGLKVDMDAIPRRLLPEIRRGTFDVNDPANTLLLLEANAIVGVTGFFSADGTTLRSVGIQCALCHSTVDDALAPRIGRRLDGWPNRDLNIGAIVAAAPDLSAFADLLQVDTDTVIKVLTSWGPGKFDAQLS